MTRNCFCAFCAMVLVLLLPALSQADSDFKPAFLSLDTNKAYMRAGPGKQYPRRFVYYRRGLPLMLLDSHEDWRKVRDREGVEGWMHRRLLSRRRMAVIITDGALLRKQAAHEGAAVAALAPGVIARLLACKQDWCLLQTGDWKGWIPQNQFYGAFAGETLQ